MRYWGRYEVIDLGESSSDTLHLGQQGILFFFDITPKKLLSQSPSSSTKLVKFLH